MALANLDGFIANWNVARYERAAAIQRADPAADVHTEIDAVYLSELSATALPALARLASAPDPTVSARATQLIRRRLHQEKRVLESWQSWTWRRASAVAQADQILAAAGQR